MLKHEQFNLGKCLAMYIARHKGDLFNFRNLFSLKYKEEVLLHKLVIKLIIVTIIDIRLINNYTIITSKSIGHVSINRVA
jgi:hypothetical protein